MAEAALNDASALSLSCGLCCNGGLFNRVELNDKDRARLAANGIDAPEQLPHPCRHFAAPACSIYAVRPWHCSDYRCEVLKGMQDGAIALETARGLVDQARTLRAQMEELLPPGVTAVRLAEDLRTEAPEQRDPTRLQALVRFAACRMFVERHFLHPKAHWMTRTKS